MTYLRDKHTLVEVEVFCYWCERVYVFLVEKKDLEKYKSGEGYVQDIFPYLSDDEREMFISGLCPKCFPKEM